MAERKQQEAAEVTQTPDEAAGVESGGQVKATADMSAKEVKESLAFEPDRKLHPSGEPERSADQSSSPGGEAYPEDPPVRTTKPDVPILRSLATGAGAHVPPSADDYTFEGRPKS